MMDEIELVRELRADLPGARDASREAARALLLERILGAEDPARRSGRWRWRHPGRRSLSLAAGVAAAAIVAVSVGVFGGGGSGVQSAAAEVLHQEADIAASLPPRTPQPGQQLFTRSKEAHLTISFREGPSVAAAIQRRLELHPNEGVQQPVWSAYIPVERQMWIGASGSGQIREVSGKARFLSVQQHAAWVAAGSPPLPRPGTVRTEHFAGHGLSGLYASRLDHLPTEPIALRRWIEAHDLPGASMSAPGSTSTAQPPVRSPEAKTFGAIGFLLGESVGPPALRAALYEVAAELPGVRLLGRVADPVGRKGVGVAYTDRQHGQRLELIFDPATSTLLGECWIVTSPKRSGIAVPSDTVFGYTAYLESKVVDSATSGTPRHRATTNEGNGR